VQGAYRSAVAESRREAARLDELTDSEHDVLHLLARPEIAKALDQGVVDPGHG
jgi:hypothetical protein